MTDQPNIGTCEYCNQTFPYVIFHNGFNESAYAYCDSCGMTAVLGEWTSPEGTQIQFYAAIKPEDEQLLLPCECGGVFRSGAAPRCPHCHQPISAESARKWIEANAPGTAGGWSWQGCWTELYGIVIDGRRVADNWRPGASSKTVDGSP